MNSRRTRRIGYGSVLLSSGLLVSPAAAQTVLAPPANPNPAQAPVAPFVDNQQQATSAPEEVLAQGQEALEWGIARFHPGVTYRLSYADGLQSAPGQSQSTVIHELSPSVRVGLGPHWTISYNPTFRFYSQSSFQNGVDHYASLVGDLAYEDWTFGFSETFSYTFQPMLQTATQTGLGSLSTGLGAKRQLGGNWSFELGFTETSSLVLDDSGDQSLTDYNRYSTLDWLNYRFASKLELGVGVGAGYDQVGGETSDMTSEQIQARARWLLSKRLSFSLSGGAECRQFVDSDQSNVLSPVMAGQFSYSPFEQTTLFLQASRSSSPSCLQDSFTETTSISVNVSQRLLKRLFLGLGVGYSLISYSATQADVSVDREDDYTFFSARLSTAFLKRGVASVFCQLTKNASNSMDYDFTSTQAGIELGYHF